MTEESTAAPAHRASIRTLLLASMAVGVGLACSATYAEADTGDKVRQGDRPIATIADGPRSDRGGSAKSKIAEAVREGVERHTDASGKSSTVGSAAESARQHRGVKPDGRDSSPQREDSRPDDRVSGLVQPLEDSAAKINDAHRDKIEDGDRTKNSRPNGSGIGDAAEPVERALDEISDEAKDATDEAKGAVQKATDRARGQDGRERPAPAPGGSRRLDDKPGRSDDEGAHNGSGGKDDPGSRGARPANFDRPFPGQDDAADPPASEPGSEADRPVDEPVIDPPAVDEPVAEPPARDEPIGKHPGIEPGADAPDGDAAGASDETEGSTIGRIVDEDVAEPVAGILDSIGGRPVGDLADNVTGVDLPPSEAAPGLVGAVVDATPDELESGLEQVIDPVIEATDPAVRGVDPVVEGAAPVTDAVRDVVATVGGSVAEPIDPVATSITRGVGDAVRTSGDGFQAGLPLPAGPGLEAVGGGVAGAVETAGGTLGLDRGSDGSSGSIVQIVDPIVKPVIPALPRPDLPDLGGSAPDLDRPLGTVPSPRELDRSFGHDGAQEPSRGLGRALVAVADDEAAAARAIAIPENLAQAAPMQPSALSFAAEADAMQTSSSARSDRATDRAHDVPTPADSGSGDRTAGNGSELAANGCSATGTAGGQAPLAAGQQLSNDFSLGSHRAALMRGDEATRHTAYDPGFSPD